MKRSHYLFAGAILAVGLTLALVAQAAFRTTTKNANLPVLYEIAAGKYTHYSTSILFGTNPDLDSVDGFEAIWELGGDYTGFDATVAETVNVVSTDADDTGAGAGAQTVQIFGLDSQFLSLRETVTLNGTTPVLTVGEYIRVNAMIVRSAGATGSNEGIITAGQSITTANVFAAMAVDTNLTRQAIVTVPANRRAIAQGWFASMVDNVTGDAQVRILIRQPDEVFILFEEWSLSATGTSMIDRKFVVPKGPIPPKSDILIQAKTTGNNVAVAAGFDLIFIPEQNRDEFE